MKTENQSNFILLPYHYLGFVMMKFALLSPLGISGKSLADLYDPNTMPPELVKAHTDLDRAVDACYGKKFPTKESRIEFLFELYKRYTQK